MTALSTTDFSLPVFDPHPWVRGGHAQTLAGAFWPFAAFPYQASEHRLLLDDGDQLVLHDDRPAAWNAGDAAVLLVHGLAGSHRSGYMQRLAAQLVAHGVRAWRMELRGCGAGRGLAAKPYHAGRSADVAAALAYIAATCPATMISGAGFSLGGNMLLKLVGEWGAAPPEYFARAAAVCPPIDLAAGSQYLRQPLSRWYDRYFVSVLVQQLAGQQFPTSALNVVQRARPRTLAEFDDCFTAPLCGFAGVEEYYRTQAAGPVFKDITVPTLVLAAADDPVVPATNFAIWPHSSSVQLELLPSGGHLGFIARGNDPNERRWMDRRLLAWLTTNQRSATM